MLPKVFRIAIFIILAAVFGLPLTGYGQLSEIEIVSLDDAGALGNGGSGDARVSADGEIIAFRSAATNLDSDISDLNGADDIYIRDRETGETLVESITSSGLLADSGSELPVLSGDGNRLAFTSSATNLVTSDLNGEDDLFLRNDIILETTRLSFVDGGGGEANDTSGPSDLNFDGSVVAFESIATNLLSPTLISGNVFVRNVGSVGLTLVSKASDGTRGDSSSSGASISSAGTEVAFSSFAANLVANDMNMFQDVFVHDLDDQMTTRVSVANDGTESDGSNGFAVISGNGRFVAFSSGATNLVAGDLNGVFDVFVHDRDSGVTTRASVSSDQTEGDGPSGVDTTHPLGISANGRFVVFVSSAANLVPNDTNLLPDIFVRDRVNKVTFRVSEALNGTEADASCGNPDISDDGLTIVFESAASTILPITPQGISHIFAADIRKPRKAPTVTADTVIEDAPEVTVKPNRVKLKLQRFSKADVNVSAARRLASHFVLEAKKKRRRRGFRYEVVVSQDDGGTEREVRRRNSRKNKVTLKNLAPGTYSAKYRVKIKRGPQRGQTTDFSPSRSFDFPPAGS